MRRLPFGRPALLLALASLGCDGEIGDVLLPPRPTAVTAQYGAESSVKAGEAVALGVRVADAQGRAVWGVRVDWSVTSGAGLFITGAVAELFPSLDGAELLGTFSSRSDVGGLARARFVPTVTGTTGVLASAIGSTGAPIGAVTFTTISPDTIVIEAGEVDWEAAWPGGPAGVSVDVGTAIEWVARADEWWGIPGRIRSVSVPTGGTAFESPILESGERFAFVPTVAGTWRWEFDDDWNDPQEAAFTAR